MKTPQVMAPVVEPRIGLPKPLSPLPLLGSRPPLIELLESRIAPAVIILSPHTATYTDVDGDHVMIQVSHGDLHNATFTTAAVGLGDQLELIDLTQGGFDGANITFHVAKGKTGDGLANVGAIDALGENLGTVKIAGDLGQIDVGTFTPGAPGGPGLALKTLDVFSMGIYGLATQGGVGDLVSEINGSLGTLKVRTDINGATINATTGSIGSALIGGSLIGGSTDSSGALLAEQQIGSLRIGGDVIGGIGANSGEIRAFSGLPSVTIGGSLIGGSGSGSGLITTVGPIQMLKIGHDIQGGSGSGSGSVTAVFTHIDNISVGGSILGGSGDGSGFISSTFGIGTITIGGDLKGGSGANSGFIQNAEGDVGSIQIGGSLAGGSGASSGVLELGFDLVHSITLGGDLQGGTGDQSGQIRIIGSLGSLVIGGSILGGAGSGSGTLELLHGITPVSNGGVIKIGQDLAGGSGVGSGSITDLTSDFGLGRISQLSIGGSVVGGTANSTGFIHVQDIGTLTIGGSLIGGSITGSDSLDTTGEIIGVHIDSIAIGGSIISGADNSTGTLTHNAGIRVSQDIGSLTVAGSILGNTSASGDSPVIISAQGEANPTDTRDLAIGSITIGGNVEHALILGGYTTSVDAAHTSLAFINSNAQIGSVQVGGDWIASSLVAGAIDVNNDGFGNADDTTGSSSPVISSIASIIIGGNVVGTSQAGDHFGFESHQIGAFTSSGFTAPLSDALAGQVFELSPTTGDVTLREVI